MFVLFQVKFVDELFNDFEDWVVVSFVFMFELQDIIFFKFVIIIIFIFVYSLGGDNVDIQFLLRLFSCEF